MNSPDRDASPPDRDAESGLVACVLGATGLVGKKLVQRLLADRRYREVHVFQRRSTGTEGAGRQAIEHVVNFDDPGTWHPELRGDVLFSALGTTRAVAGSQEAQHRVDHDYQVEAARSAAENGIEALVLVSAMGANPRARAFYSRLKGEVEEAVTALPFRTVHILRPGVLDGERAESRPMERLGILLARGLARLGAPAALRPIPDEAVAEAMARLGVRNATGPRVQVHEQAALFRLASRR
jgi:uncharacterized protein YbjT (DUF2867 family)